ncbi:CHAT domain-containing tetratricopeptide repeat protein [Aulosira sp. FACHB-615]|uniref:CHAT domain-containing protein n=1 Tax=Aulosira sp. FACHB-615 TaxID=2692777 RepID=UPI001687E614|nr:CHAT domain-containing tetratricopeptide repeat protein [Aulosira sp. FACHB-615]MBD2491361.1 CHAT domain-containing protein [Aulosira sp. FACHB-615]
MFKLLSSAFSSMLSYCLRIIKQYVCAVFILRQISRLHSQAAEFIEHKKYEKALPYYQKSYFLARKYSLIHCLPHGLNSVIWLAFLYRTMGRYVEAESLYNEARKIITKTLGTNHFHYAHCIYDLAETYWLTKQYDKAELLYQEARTITQKVLDPDFPDYITCLKNLASLYELQKRYYEAELLYQEAINITVKVYGTNHSSYVISLTYLATFYKSTRRYAEAESLFQEILNIIARVSGSKTPLYANYLAVLANLYFLMEKYTEAEALYQEALEIYQAFIKDDNFDELIYIISLKNLGELYYTVGKYTEAESSYIQALDIIAKNEEITYDDYPYILNNLAQSYYAMERYAEAENLYLQALEEIAKYQEYNYNDYAGFLNNLAQLYHSVGKYTEAESVYHKSLSIIAQSLGCDNFSYAGCLSNLAWLYRAIGRYSEAHPLYLHALEITAKVYGTNHSLYATSLNNLAQSYCSIRQYSEAEPLYQKALEVIAKHQGNNHPNYAISLDNLALLYHEMGRDVEAEPLYREALKLKANIWGNAHHIYAVSLNNLAQSYFFMLRYNDAEILYIQALEIAARVIGNKHPEYAKYLENLAFLYAATERLEESLILMQESADIDLKTLSQIFNITTDNQRLTYLQQNYFKLEYFLSLVFQYFTNIPSAVQSAYNLVLKRKAIATETTILQKIAILSEQYSHLAPKLKQWRQVRQKLAKRYFDIPTPEQSIYYQSEIDSLIQQAETLERELNLPELNLQKELQNADYRTVALELPESTTLVEFVRFNVFNFKSIPTNNESQWFPPRYLAFILPAREAEHLKMIDLGEAEPIDRLVRKFRESVEIGRGLDLGEIAEADEIEPFFELLSLVFDKLKPYLSKNLFICPDGELNCLPFEALTINEEEYLIDEYNFNFLTVGRDILRFKSQVSAEVTKPLVIANPDYDLVAKNNNTTFLIAGETLEERSIDYQEVSNSRGGQIFLSLPGTAIEGEKIAKLLGVKAFMQAKALKSLILNPKSSPYILHIATHGYFLEDIKPKQEEKIRQNFLLLNLSASERLQLGTSQNPLLRSGLAFAGANTMLNGNALPEEAEDGLLTALDVQLLNLAGTELVVTSACETALGAIITGETVIGLRRSFIQAGAKTVVMSLWKVPDIATAILMERFYHYLLQARLGKAEALKKAKYDVRNISIGQMRSYWLTEETIEWARTHSKAVANHLMMLNQKYDDERPYEHPRYWAAFICLGNPAPLNEFTKY